MSHRPRPSFGSGMSQYFTVHGEAREVFPEQASVTLIGGIAFDDVVRRLGGDLTRATEGNWGEVYDRWDDLDEEDGDDGPDEDIDGIMFAARHADWTVIMEPFGFRSTGHEFLQDFTAGGRALSMWWTVNAEVTVTYAAEARIVATFDPFDLDRASPRSGRDWLRGLSISEQEWKQDWMAACFALGEEISGVRLDREWLELPHSIVPLLARNRPPRPGVAGLKLDEDMEAVIARDPRLARIVAEPTNDKLPEIIQMAVELALDTTGLDGPLVDEARRLIDTGDRTSPRARSIRDELTALADRLLTQAHEVYVSSPDRAEGASMDPGHNTGYGRLRLRREAVLTLSSALAADPDLGRVARDTVRSSGMTHLNQENGDNDRQRTLHVVAYYIHMGENPW
jgi:hypothetical protein